MTFPDEPQEHREAPSQREPCPRWLLILPSGLLFGLFAIPLLALVVRSLGSDFLVNTFSRQAFHALSLSLVTSTHHDGDRGRSWERPWPICWRVHARRRRRGSS